MHNSINPPRPTAMVRACRMAVALLVLAGANQAKADSFVLPNGMEGQWSLNAVAGASWRAANRDPALVSAMNGGRAGVGNGHDDGNLNFNKGSVFASGPKVTGELQLKQDRYGLFLRATAWYDHTLETKKVPHGSFNTGYARNAKLSDAGFDELSSFSGASLADAYVFGTFDLADTMPLTLKLGNQVVNWGESTFIPGINAMGAFDLTAAHRPGAQVKEILRPLPQLTANLGLGGGLSLEAFYQFKWKRTVLDGCGTFWSLADSLNCPKGAVVFGDALGNDKTQFDGVPLFATLPAALRNAVGAADLAATPINFKLGRAPEVRPKDSGQFGLSAHYFAEARSTDFGLYFTNHHTRVPFTVIVKTPSQAPSIYSGQYAAQFAGVAKALAAAGNVAGSKTFGLLASFPGAQTTWSYGAENIQTVALSAATELGGFSVFGEMSHTHGVPLQLNGADLLVGAVLGLGPQAALSPAVRNPATPAGTVLPGYERKDKNQIQMSFVRILPQVLGASAATVIGEVGMQHWSGIGNPATSSRYGRGFLFGFGPTAALGNTCAGLNAAAEYCENEGYATRNAWGYRLQGELNYSNAFAGVNLKPRVFWSHDVKGYSGDGTFQKDRRTLGTSLRADYLSRYYSEVSYTRYNKKAKYDVMHDRDYFSLIAGINF